jgi:lipopolysaccharide/colanic/teichoic acid biosynthesis glycosyltransferase
LSVAIALTETAQRMTVTSDSDPMWSVPDHRGMTRIGWFLRRRCPDELFQVFNVLRSDMSLVGPQPWPAPSSPSPPGQGKSVVTSAPGA